MLTKSIITGVLVASLGGGTYYFGEESIRSYLEERLQISRIQKQIIPVKPKRIRSGKKIENVDSSSDMEYTFFKTLTSSNANTYTSLSISNNSKLNNNIPKPRKISLKQTYAKKKSVQKPQNIPVVKKVEKPKIDASLDYMVQVSSFRELDGAEKMKNQLIANGYSAFSLRVEIPEKGVWYRVYLGKFANKEEANLAAESAKTKDNLSAVVHQVS